MGTATILVGSILYFLVSCVTRWLLKKKTFSTMPTVLLLLLRDVSTVVFCVFASEQIRRASIGWLGNVLLVLAVLFAFWAGACLFSSLVNLHFSDREDGESAKAEIASGGIMTLASAFVALVFIYCFAVEQFSSIFSLDHIEALLSLSIVSSLVLLVVKDPISNYCGGLQMRWNGVIWCGAMIRYDGKVCVVVEIGSFYTKLQAGEEDALYIVPNALLASGKVELIVCE